MFFRYEKRFWKAVKLGSFLQCLVHIFLGHDGCFWKINLRILWNHIMKNFQVKHGQCDSVILPQKLLLDICLADSRILYFWYVLKSIHTFIIELHARQCLFVRGLIKNNGGVGLFQISQKERLFHLLWQPTSTLWGNLIMRSPFLHPSKKAFLSPSVWTRREYTWTLNWKDSLPIYFQNC